MLLLSLWFILLSYPSAIKTRERRPVKKKNAAQGYDGTKTTARRHSQTLGAWIFWKPCDIGEAKEEQKNRRILNYQGIVKVFWYLVGDWALIAPFSSLGVFGTIKGGSVFCPFKVEHLSLRVNRWVSGEPWQVKRRVRWILWFLVARDLYPPKVLTCFTWKKPHLLRNFGDFSALGTIIFGERPCQTRGG